MTAAGIDGVVIGGGLSTRAGDECGGERAAVEGGDNAEGHVEGRGEVGDEGVEGGQKVLLRLAASSDGTLHLVAHLRNGGDVVNFAIAIAIGWRFHAWLSSRGCGGRRPSLSLSLSAPIRTMSSDSVTLKHVRCARFKLAFGFTIGAA